MEPPYLAKEARHFQRSLKVPRHVIFAQNYCLSSNFSHEVDSEEGIPHPLSFWSHLKVLFLYVLGTLVTPYNL